MTDKSREAFLERIRTHISTHGYHITVVQGGPLPRFAYTVGLHPKTGFEIAFAGGSFFTNDEMLSVVREFARRIAGVESFELFTLDINGLGRFSLQGIEPSWSRKILLGAFDFFGLNDIKAYQINPDRAHWTIDVPDMKESWNPAAEPIWRWLDDTWELPVSPKSIAKTNLNALRGRPITEAMRWEEREWEVFAGAGPDVSEADLRKVPLGTMLGFDVTLEPVAELEIGSGVWREGKGLDWHPWRKREEG
jgi:hypothetical protein